MLNVGLGGRSRLLLGGTLIPSLDRLGHSEPVEGQRPTDSDADSAGGFAPLAEPPRYPSGPISMNRRSWVGHCRTLRGNHPFDHHRQITFCDVERSGDDGTQCQLERDDDSTSLEGVHDPTEAPHRHASILIGLRVLRLL